MLKKPKFELGKLMELNSEGSSCEKLLGVTEAEAEQADGYNPQSKNLLKFGLLMVTNKNPICGNK